ncbi:CHAT domain-containing protein [Plectosphaerella plurivora]|uniref:CHAT domain-containing protein n=1 Tax=Plectosphaerella plurivora TaxID=936078 RepID=A0A9P8VDM6_9PEZI|nr:CHAT domain-containing protein [Plectosphaerella plurivora]
MESLVLAYADRHDSMGTSGDLDRAISAQRDVIAVLGTLNAATGISSLAAATALQAGKDPLEALQVLELGRGIIAGLMMDLRMDVSELKVSHPELADKLASLQDKLGDSEDDKIDIFILKPQEDIAGWELRMKDRRQAEENMDQLIEEIRGLSGFNDFLSTPSASSLANTASYGPIIVINTSRYRCDAFLVDKTGTVRVVKLPDLTEAEVDNRAANLPGDDLEGLLEWMWHTICRPCLDELGFTYPTSLDGQASLPRVWWVATGLAARLPLHAAGLHRDCCGDTVMDRVMSSYAPSIKALMHGRRPAGRALSEESPEVRPEVGSPSAVLVAMPETPGPGPSPLKGATQEVDWLSQKCPALSLTAIKPVARRKEVLELLRSCHIFHFAGHGSSDPKDASRSHLLLDDWKESPLTVGDLRDNWQRGAHQPFLAYLSACSTGADLGRLRDESIHLVSAFQLAGFRHVVGTLWMVDDGACVEVAKTLYSTLADEGVASDEAVCKGLHRALVMLRDREVEEMTMADEADEFEEARRGRVRDATLDDDDDNVGLRGMWVPYVHYGA